jgi:hypothetical protein
MHPIDAFLRTNLITAKEAARHDGARVGSDPDSVDGRLPVRASRESRLRHHCAAIEQMSQAARARVRAERVRVVCLRPTAIADAPSNGSYTGELWGDWAAEAGLSIEEMLVQWART